jgi:hypothetical protein
MNWNWETIREQAKVAYARTSQLLVFLGVCFYLLACIVASKPVGPKNYVGFAYHCFQWEPPHKLITPVYSRAR